VPPDYRVRAATLADVDTLVRHRIAMFTDMQVPLDARELDRAFRVWLAQMMPAGTYRAWFDSPAAAALQGTEEADFPFWSPDGRWLAFFARGKLKKIRADGGLVQVLCDAPWGRGGAWSRDRLRSDR